MVQALRAHVFAEDASVGRQPRNRDPEVLVDLEDLTDPDAWHAERKGQACMGGEYSGSGSLAPSWTHLSLVIRQIRCRALESGQNSMRRRPNADSSTALLDGFHGVLDLVETSLWTPRRYVRVVLRQHDDRNDSEYKT